MKDTCVVRISADSFAYFYPGNNRGSAYIDSWPDILRRKFSGVGVYSIRSVKKSSPRSVRVVIQGLLVIRGEAYHNQIPAMFLPFHYGICAPFLDQLGITLPPAGKRKTLHLVVTKRRK